jgi:hypothetical protein
MTLKSPKGTVIVGTLEIVPGWAGIHGSVKRGGNGRFEFDHDGETRLDWDGQRTVERDGERIFVDADGSEFKESELVLE